MPGGWLDVAPGPVDVTEPVVEVASDPLEPVPAPPVAVPAVERIPRPKKAAQAIAPVPPPVDEDDVWEDPDEPVSQSEPPRARQAEPRNAPTATPPEHLPERRVVVIDEDAEPASSRPAPRGSADDEPASPHGVASIGATLEEEEGHVKRRWRLFRKGGE